MRSGELFEGENLKNKMYCNETSRTRYFCIIYELLGTLKTVACNKFSIVFKWLFVDIHN